MQGLARRLMLPPLRLLRVRWRRLLLRSGRRQGLSRRCIVHLSSTLMAAPAPRMYNMRERAAMHAPAQQRPAHVLRPARR